jgi:cytoskeletal protein RodZ
MTARHQIRVGNRRLGRTGTTPIDATPAPSLGEILQVARERKGVDLFRAERDTKIRAKHLAALESDDYAELPGAVYTKGFLRNYAVYLGLDAEEVLARWRDQTATPSRRAEQTVVAPPQPLSSPRGGLTFTRGVFVTGLMTFVILAFAAYVVLQVVRFAQTSPVSVDGPAVRQVAADAENIVLRGASAAGATVVITGGGGFQRETTADARGDWSAEVPLTKGRNDFTIVARDPVTSRNSEPVNVIIEVPVPATPSPVASPSGGAALPSTALVLTAPLDGSTVSDGRVVVTGTTDAATVSISAVRVGEAGATPGPSAAPSAGPTAAPGASPAAPAATDVTVVDGAFTHTLAVGSGRWQLSVTATAAEHGATTVTRSVDVVFQGVSLTVTATGGSAWIQVVVDGEIADGHRAGKIYRRNTSETFLASETIVVRTGNSGATHFTLDGESLGALGGDGAVETWIFEKGSEPRRG